MQGISRRRLIAVSLGGIGIGSIGAYHSTRESAAVDVSAGELAIEDAEHAGEPDAVNVEVTTEVEWEASTEPDAIEVSLYAGADTDSVTLLTSETHDTDSTDGTHTATLTGDVTESATLALSDFELLVGQERRTVDVGVAIDVELVINGSVQAETRISDMTTVTITEEMDAEITVSGEGEFVIE